MHSLPAAWDPAKLQWTHGLPTWLLALFTIPHTQHSGYNEIWVTDPLAPAVHRLLAQHQSDNQQAALADYKNPIWRKTCNPTGGGFCWIVAIWPDLDIRSDIHPSIVDSWWCNSLNTVSNWVQLWHRRTVRQVLNPDCIQQQQHKSNTGEKCTLSCL